MSRQKNDGRGRMGGRAKGTPNKATATIKEWLVAIIDSNRDRVVEDLEKLDPRERLIMIEKFMQYVVPKQSAVKAEISSLSDEEISTVTDRLLRNIK